MQVFYAGPEEMPAEGAAFMEGAFRDVKFIDITAMPELPARLNMKVAVTRSIQ